MESWEANSAARVWFDSGLVFGEGEGEPIDPALSPRLEVRVMGGGGGIGLIDFA